MPQAGPSSTVSLANVPTLANLALPSANTEVAYTFPDNTLKFSFKARNAAIMKFAFAPLSSEVFTIIGYFAEDAVDLSGVTIYLQSSTANQIVEILSWQRV